MLMHTWDVLCFFPESIQSRIHNKTFALNASALKYSYGTLYQALNKPSMSDFIASVEHEIRKDLAVLDSCTRFGKVSYAYRLIKRRLTSSTRNK